MRIFVFIFLFIIIIMKYLLVLIIVLSNYYSILNIQTNLNEDKTRIFMLGTGTPGTEFERMGSGVAITYKGKYYIIDSGPGILNRIHKLNIPYELLTNVFLTHLHSDHTTGLSDLILGTSATGRKFPMTVYGPPGVKNMVDSILNAYNEDIMMRLEHQPEIYANSYKINSVEISNQSEIYRDDTMKVTAFNVKHGDWKYAYGYRFEANDGSVIVISGDTSYCENLIEFAKDCDVLIHEVYSNAGFLRRTEAWQKYHHAYHTSSIELGIIAAKSNIKKLVLYHSLPMGETYEKIIEEVKLNYKGEILLPNDLDIIDL